MTRKFDQYTGVREIITKVRELAWANKSVRADTFRGSSVANPDIDWESDPLRMFLRSLPELSVTLKKDLSKVDFDWENYTSATDLMDLAWEEIKDTFGYSRSIMGPHNQMGNKGVSWIGCAAGGDWEEPVFFMLYICNGALRAWIPRDGNCWNRTTKQAFGNDNKADIVDIKKQLKSARPEVIKEHEDEGYNDEILYEYAPSLKDSDIIRQSIRTHFKPHSHVSK